MKRMAFGLATALMVLLPMVVPAATETVDGIEWTYVIAGGGACVGSRLDLPGINAIPESTTGSVTIPSTLGGFPVTRIGDEAFSDCSGLTSVTIPEGVTSIGQMAFSGCSGLTSMTIPSSVAEVGGGYQAMRYTAFMYCSGLTSFSVDASNPSYSSRNGLLCSKDGTVLVAGVNGDVTIPDGVTSIGDRAFYGCSGLTSVTIPSSVTDIGYMAFHKCTNLTSVAISEGVTFLGNFMFNDCSGLKSVTISSSVTFVGASAFSGCSGIESVTVEAVVPPSIDNSAFSSCGVLSTIYIPNGTIAAYEAAEGWKDYAAKFVEMVPVAELSIVWDDEGIVYDGKGKMPGVVAKDGDAVLASGTAYTVVYEGNTNAGTAKAILTGLPPYVGSVTNEFTIAKRPVTLMSGTKTDFVYDGQPHQFPVLIKSENWFVDGEGIATSNWATVMAVADGEVDNAFDYAPLEGTKLENYDLTVVTGKIAVVQATSVEITEAWQSNPGSGVVDFTYKVSGFAGATYDLLIKVGARGATPKIVTYEDVSAGTVTTNINYRQLLGKAYPNVSLSASLKERYVQLWKDGPYWAKCNVGASRPEESGYYFWWGDTVGYKRNANNDGWISVKDGASFLFYGGDNCPTHGKDNFQLQSEGYIDATGNLVAAHDAATAHLGAPWRMPTDAEFSALLSNCTRTWTNSWNGSGVQGWIVTGKGAYASKSIFLPATGFGYGPALNYLGSRGYFWASTPCSDDPYRAWRLRFLPDIFYRDGYTRSDGHTVRPVRGFAE